MRQETVLVLSNVTTGLVNFRNELLSLLKTQYKVVVIADDTGRSEELLNIGCELDTIELERHGTNPIHDMKLISLYKKKIMKYKPMVVLTYTIKPNVYGGLACSQLNIPYISNITGLGDAIENKGLVSLIAKNLYRIGLRKAKIVYFQNKANLDFFIENRLYKGRFELLPGSGVNLEKNRYEEYPKLNENNPIILSVVGRVTRDKGINEIIEASKVIDKNKIHIYIIGDCEGDYIERLKKESQKGVIEYVGRQNNVHEWMKNSHAILHASYHEGLSNVLLEAAACGRPIIATNIPGCKETFNDGVTGISFTPREVNSLVEAINKFISLSYNEKAKMGLEGRKKIEKEFDRKIVVNKYITTIKAIERERELDESV